LGKSLFRLEVLSGRMDGMDEHAAGTQDLGGTSLTYCRMVRGLLKSKIVKTERQANILLVGLVIVNTMVTIVMLSAVKWDRLLL